MDIEPAWEEFNRIIKLYEKMYADLNKGATIKQIGKAEKDIGVDWPLELQHIYLQANGQKGADDGIFKAVSGFNKYERPKYLQIKDVVKAYKSLVDNKDIDVFEPTYIPFAASPSVDVMDDVFVIDSKDGVVYLLWVLLYDPFSPPDWQTMRLKRGDDLGDFLMSQVKLYW